MRDLLQGIERDTGLLMGEVIAQVMPEREMAVLSGPTFAAEVAADMATGVTVAAAEDGFHDGHLAARVAVSLASESFRPYLSDDVRGVEIGGAAKNVIAIACGIATGLGLGSNARAMIITRGLTEITALGLAIGARLETLAGLAGAGDLMLTCSSTQSRNFSFGKALGAGEEAVRRADGPVVEGAENAASVVALARRLEVPMPVCETVLAILDGAPVAPSMKALMLADLHPEAVGAQDDWTTPHPARIDEVRGGFRHEARLSCRRWFFRRILGRHFPRRLRRAAQRTSTRASRAARDETMLVCSHRPRHRTSIAELIQTSGHAARPHNTSSATSDTSGVPTAGPPLRPWGGFQRRRSARLGAIPRARGVRGHRWPTSPASR